MLSVASGLATFFFTAVATYLILNRKRLDEDGKAEPNSYVDVAHQAPLAIGLAVTSFVVFVMSLAWR
jgi:hypothetical protein